MLLWLFFSGWAQAADLVVTDREDNDIGVQRYQADSDILIIWLVDHRTRREMFEQMLVEVNRAGMEIWRVDLLNDYFLTRSSENQRTLSGDGVEALLEAAHQYPHKHILLAGYDRMPLAILRGIHQWHGSTGRQSRLAGAFFFYPNLFGPAPVAGQDPVLDPVVDVATVPIMIFQPDGGYLRWRIMQVMQRLWAAGSPAFIYLVPDVRDWFFMGGELDHGSGDKAATAKIPQQLHHFSRLMAGLARATNVQSQRPRPLEQQPFRPASKQLVTFADRRKAPGFELADVDDVPFSATQYRGKVLLVNFWATWCPPCVEEIPSLNALQSNYPGKNFEIVSINYRETVRQLQAFSSKIPVNFPVLMDYDGKISLDWKVFSFPSSFLVDRHGYIRHSINQAIDWNSEEIRGVIDGLLNE